MSSQRTSIDSLSAKWFVRPGDVVFDIGTFDGRSAELYFERGASAVFAFEPLEADRRRIPERVISHPGFKLHPFALSEVSGPQQMLIPDINPGAATLSSQFSKWYLDQRSGAAVPCSVDVRRLDDLDLPRADFWKIDVEGAELNVLRGAARTLREQKPDIVQLEIFCIEPERYDETLTLLEHHFPYLWAIGVTADHRPICHDVTREIVGYPEFHADLQRGGTPHYYASHRTHWEWMEESEAPT